MSPTIIKLRPSERKALMVLAKRERRDPRDQAALIIRRELEQRGLLPADGSQSEKRIEEQSAEG